MRVPDDLRYTTDHEWARRRDGRVRIGITDYAQDALGRRRVRALPAVGSDVQAGGPLGEVESTKSVSEIYAPVGRRSGRRQRSRWRRTRAAECRPLRRRLDLRDRPERSRRPRGTARCGALRGADARGRAAIGADSGEGTSVDGVFCNNCGHRNPAGANFCSSCGAVLTTAAPPMTTVTLHPVDAARGGRRRGADRDASRPPEGRGTARGEARSERGDALRLESDVTRVGRHPESDIFLDDITVSRRHAEFVKAAARLHRFATSDR